MHKEITLHPGRGRPCGHAPCLTAGGVPAAPPTHPMPRAPSIPGCPPFFVARKAGVHCDTALGKSSHFNGGGPPGAKAESARPGQRWQIKQERPADEAPRHISNQRRRRPFSGADQLATCFAEESFSTPAVTTQILMRNFPWAATELLQG